VRKEKEGNYEVEGAVALPRIVVMPLQRVLAITHPEGRFHRLRDRERRGGEREKEEDRDKEESEERERKKQ